MKIMGLILAAIGFGCVLGLQIWATWIAWKLRDPSKIMFSGLIWAVMLAIVLWFVGV